MTLPAAFPYIPFSIRYMLPLHQAGTVFILNSLLTLHHETSKTASMPRARCQEINTLGQSLPQPVPRHFSTSVATGTDIQTLGESGDSDENV